MKSLYKRNAMTLVEILIVFAIIGILSAIAIIVANPNGKNEYYLYKKAYDIITTATYNAYLDNGEEWLDKGSSDNEKVLNICKVMTKYINSKDATSTNTEFKAFDGNSDYGFCNSNYSLLPSDGNKTSLVSSHPLFIGINNMKYYISDLTEIAQNGGGENSSCYTPDEDNSTIKYRLMYIDVDGDKNNSLTQPITESNTTDVYVFAIFQNGYAIPLGTPAIDKKYLSVSTKYKSGFLSRPTNYYRARFEAWGNLYCNPEFMDSYFKIINDNLSGVSPVKLSDSQLNKALTDNNITVTEQDGECKLNTTTKTVPFECDIVINKKF